MPSSVPHEAQASATVQPSSRRRTRLIARFDEVAPRFLSLDVFDTLLARPFPRPTDLFPEIHRALTEQGGQALGIDAARFAHLRIEAESAARKSARAGEVRLEEICEELSRSLEGRVSAADLAAAELATERAFIFLDPDVAALVKHAASRGVPYVLVSDMYLRKEQIAELVDAASSVAGAKLPAPLRVFVSSEERDNKGGGMFDVVLAALGAKPEEVLHVGDHPQSDVAIPRARRLHTEHVPSESPILADILAREARYMPQGIPDHHYDVGLRTLRLKAATSGAEVNEGPLDAFQYGSFILGPLYTLFAEWVVEQCVRAGEDRAYCMMREGHLLAPLIEKAARARGVKLDVRKLWTSRYVIRGASFHHVSEEEVYGYLFKRRYPSVSVIARDLGLDEVKLRDLSDVRHDTYMTEPELHRLVRVIVTTPELSQQMVDESSRKRKRLFDYLRREGVLDRERVTLVDLGWAGSSQRRLAHALRHEARPTYLRGLYFATHDYALMLPAERCSAEGWLFDLGLPEGTWKILTRTLEILELSTMPRHGSLRDFDAAGEPVVFDHVLSERQQDDIEAIQRGVMHFAELWLPESKRRRAHISLRELESLKSRLRALAARSVHDPTLDEVRLFDHWEHDPNDGSLDRENLIGDPPLRERARFMTYAQIMEMRMLESFWPAALARLVDKTPDAPPQVRETVMRIPPVRMSANLFSRSAAAVARLFGRK